jgi:hypothetical protein
MLLWGYGLGGFLGIALLETRSTPALDQPDDVRSVS